MYIDIVIMSFRENTKARYYESIVLRGHPTILQYLTEINGNFSLQIGLMKIHEKRMEVPHNDRCFIAIVSIAAIVVPLYNCLRDASCND